MLNPISSIVSSGVSLVAGGVGGRLTRVVGLCLVLGLTGRAGAQVNLFDTALTSGSGAFNDTAAGGTLETMAAAGVIPNNGISGHTMNYPGYVTYSSGVPHVDTGTLTVDITQTFNSVPFFGVSGRVAQAGAVTGDTTTLTYNFQSSFEGLMTGADPSIALTSLGMPVSGNVGANPGAFTQFTMQQDYYDVVSLLYIGYLSWNNLNTTPGAFSYTVYPTWNPVGATLLTNNLIKVQGSLVVQADPSSISFGSVVPEPASAACLALVGLASVARRRRA